MKRVLYTKYSIEQDKPHFDDIPELIIEEVRNGELEATMQMLQQYHMQVASVAFDVLQDEALSREVAWETLVSAVKQLRTGMRVGAFEPWLMWLARSDALRYTQAKRAPQAVEKVFSKPPMATARTAVKPAGIRKEPTHNAPLPRPVTAPFDDLWPTSAYDDSVTGSTSDGLEEEYSTRMQKKATMKNLYENETPLRNVGDGKKEDGAQAERRGYRKRKSVALTVGMALLCLTLLWVVFGLIAKNTLGAFPDMGYSWFNNNVFPMF